MKKILLLNLLWLLLIGNSANASRNLKATKSTKYDAAYYEKSVKKQAKYSSQSPTDGIVPGTGYSTDTQSIARTACYKPLPGTIRRTGQSGIINFEHSISLDRMANMFNVSASFNGGNGKFSANAMFKYFNELTENHYSTSFNYYQKISHNVHMSYSYSPKSILTEVGQEIYNNGENPMFRMFCGDTLITSYEEGAALMMSMRVVFDDKFQKHTFDAAIGGSVGSFFNASANIKNAADRYHLQGRIVISAYQLGGDPSQLSKLLRDSTVSCKINDVTKCQETAAGLIHYASNIYPNQFQRQGGHWISPLVPLGGFVRDHEVSDFGMKLAPSYATPVVRSAREQLIQKYDENKVKEMRYVAILNGYRHLPRHHLMPFIPLSPELEAAIIRYRENVAKNMRILGSEPGGALDCWKMPHKCESVFSSINQSLINENPDFYLTSCRNPEGYVNWGEFCNIGGRARRWHRVDLVGAECRGVVQWNDDGLWRVCNGYVPYYANRW